MSPLASFQDALADYLLAAPERGAGETLTGLVRAQGAPASERLAVYKNNVHSTLIDALAATFPAVERLVGAEFFRYAAREYASIHPPRHAALIGYGEKFPQFLSRFPPAATVPYLPDVAQLETLYLEAYHAPEAQAMDAAELAAALEDPDRARIGLHPSARLMASRYPVSRIWELNRRDGAFEGKTRIPGAAEQLLIIRPQASVEVRRIGAGAYAALAALARGRPLGAALAAAGRAAPGVDLVPQMLSLAEGETFQSTEHTR